MAARTSKLGELANRLYDYQIFTYRSIEADLIDSLVELADGKSLNLLSSAAVTALTKALDEIVQAQYKLEALAVKNGKVLRSYKTEIVDAAYDML